MVSAAFVIIAFAPPADSGALEARAAEVLADCQMCHGAGDEKIDLTKPLSSYIDTASSTGTPMVAPGDPGGSYLYQKLIGADIEGSPMPLGGDTLPDEDLAVIRDWISSLGPAPENGATTIPEPVRNARANFFGTHQVNQQTTTTLGAQNIEFRIHHRFGQLGAKRSYLGLAGSSIMSIGAAYGIVDGLDLMLRWSNSNLDWEVGTKYVPVRQKDGMPLSFGMYASFEALGQDPALVNNRFTGNFSVMASRLWFERWSTQLMVNYSMFTNHSASPTADLGDGVVPVEDNRGTLNVGVASTVWVDKKRNWGIDTELGTPIPTDTFYYAGGNAREGFPFSYALGFSAKAGLHLFQVFVTNTQNIHTNLVAPGSDSPDPSSDAVTTKDFFARHFLGFNISRKWDLNGKGRKKK